MKKRIISIVLTLAVVISLGAALAPAAVADTFAWSGVTGNIAWEVVLDPDALDGSLGTLRITRRSGFTGTNVHIPNFGSATASPWHRHNVHVGQIVIGEYITQIGNWAFANFERVTEVHIEGNADRITRIGNDAFRGCRALSEFLEPDGVVAGNWVTASFGGLTTLGANAFNGCASLLSIHMPVVTSLNANAFIGTASLNSIVAMPHNAPGAGNFRVTAEGILMQGVIVSGVWQARNVIKAPVGLLNAQAIIPPTVHTIEAEAFAYMTNLTSIIIPTSVTTVRARAFADSPLLNDAIFLGNAPTVANWGANVFQRVGPEFYITYFPHATGWSAPTWRGLPTRVTSSHMSVPSLVTVNVNASATFLATILPTTVRQAVTIAATNTSIGEGVNPSDNDIATISVASTAAGGVTLVAHGRSVGSLLVRLDAVDSDAYAYLTLTVQAPGVPTTGVILQPNALRLYAPPSPANPLPPDVIAERPNYGYITAIVLPPGATDQNLTAVSSNTNIAVVTPVEPPAEDEAAGPARFRVRAVAPGTATITVRTAGGQQAQATITVVGIPNFVPITNITGIPSSAAMGSVLDLNELSAVQPANATNRETPIVWEVVSASSGMGIALGTIVEGILNVPWGDTGSITIRATIPAGIADTDWGFPADADFTRQFTISVTNFIPATSITAGPFQTFVGVPLTLTGTVSPPAAANRPIEWDIVTGPGGSVVEVHGVPQGADCPIPDSCGSCVGEGDGEEFPCYSRNAAHGLSGILHGYNT